MYFSLTDKYLSSTKYFPCFSSFILLLLDKNLKISLSKSLILFLDCPKHFPLFNFPSLFQNRRPYFEKSPFPFLFWISLFFFLDYFPSILHSSIPFADLSCWFSVPGSPRQSRISSSTCLPRARSWPTSTCQSENKVQEGDVIQPTLLSIHLHQRRQKVSYSTMPNMAQMLNQHNTKVNSSNNIKHTGGYNGYRGGGSALCQAIARQRRDLRSYHRQQRRLHRPDRRHHQGQDQQTWGGLPQTRLVSIHSVLKYWRPKLHEKFPFFWSLRKRSTNKIVHSCPGQLNKWNCRSFGWSLETD